MRSGNSFGWFGLKWCWCAPRLWGDGGGGTARTHRLQVVHADGELPQHQQQVQLRVQKRDVAHLQESKHQPGTERSSETLPEASASAAGPCTGRFKSAPEGLAELPGRPLSRLTSDQSALAQVASQGSQRSRRLTGARGEILELTSQHTHV